MKAERILTAPFEFVQIIKCEIQKAVNEHGFAILKGYISPDREEQYLLMAGEQTEVTIRAVEDEKESRQIYCGIVEDMKIILTTMDSWVAAAAGPTPLTARLSRS